MTKAEAAAIEHALAEYRITAQLVHQLTGDLAKASERMRQAAERLILALMSGTDHRVT